MEKLSMKSAVKQQYSDTSFWQKIKKFSLMAGREVIENALWLYYAAQEKDTPLWAKTAIFTALAYFICPIDSIPDVIPVAGYTDDLGVIAAAIGMVSIHITDSVKAKARQSVKNIFS
jgi:uncharacterized membrane protein YkvA (DUF1232 family)